MCPAVARPERGVVALQGTPMNELNLGRLVAELHAAIDALHSALGVYQGTTPLRMAEYRVLERSFDRYQTADKALSDHVDSMIRSLAPRPRT